MISKADCERGVVYRGEGRNFKLGIWNGERFLGIRSKWGSRFIDSELHWEASPPHGTFKPEEAAYTLPGELLPGVPLARGIWDDDEYDRVFSWLDGRA